VKRHPEDPPDAFEKAATEIADPEEIRRRAVGFGKGSQAIEPEWFDLVSRGLYRSVHDTRIGAITIPAQRQSGEQLKVVATAEAAIAEIQAEGGADADKAERLERDAVPRAQAEQRAAEEAVKEAEQRLETARENRARVREEEEEKRERRKTERPRPSLGGWRLRSDRNLFARFGFSPLKAWLVFLFEVLGSGYLLAQDVADVVGTSYWTGFGVSIVISVAMLSAALAAGIGLAAIRLPGWVAGGTLLAGFAAILVKFVPALDALRLAEESGIETLTAATLGAFLIAMVSGYALAVAADDEATVQAADEKAELIKEAGSPLGDAVEIFAAAEMAKSAADEEKCRCDALLHALWEKIEKLRDDAGRSAAAVERRRLLGIEAEVEVETIQATAQSAIEQEEAAAEWAHLIALAAHEKARMEDLPELPVAPVAAISEPSPGAAPRALSMLQILALAAAAVSGLASLVLGLIPLGVGIPLAALLVAVDFRSKAGGDDEDSGAPINPHPRIAPPANGDDPLYRYQPDHMDPKYRNGGAGAGQHQ
jgi:hypothetical protein